MGNSRWMVNVGLLATMVAAGAALNFFPAAAAVGAGVLTAALSFFLLALAVAGVNLINAGVCLMTGTTEMTLGCISTVVTTRFALSKVAAFARRNVAALGVAGASAAATGVIIFAAEPVPCFVCFALFLVAMSLIKVGGLARSTARVIGMQN